MSFSSSVKTLYKNQQPVSPQTMAAMNGVAVNPTPSNMAQRSPAQMPPMQKPFPMTYQQPPPGYNGNGQQVPPPGPWNQKTPVIGSQMNSAMSNLSPNNLGTISSAALRHQQMSMGPNQNFQQLQSMIPAAPTQPPAHLTSKKALTQYQEGIAGGTNINPGLQPTFRPAHQIQQPQPSPPHQQYQHPSAPVQQVQNLVETSQGTPRYAFMYNRNSDSSVQLVTEILQNTQEPHLNVFDWSVTLVDVTSPPTNETSQLIQNIASAPEYRNALNNGVLLYDYIQDIIHVDPTTIVRMIRAQKHLFLDMLVQKEKYRRDNPPAVQNGTFAKPQFMDEDGGQGFGGSMRAHHGVTEFQAQPTDVRSFVRKSVLGRDVNDFMQNAEAEASKITITTGDNRQAPKQGQYNNSHQFNNGNQGNFANGGQQGGNPQQNATIQQIDVRQAMKQTPSRRSF